MFKWRRRVLMIIWLYNGIKKNLNNNGKIEVWRNECLKFSEYGYYYVCLIMRYNIWRNLRGRILYRIIFEGICLYNYFRCCF